MKLLFTFLLFLCVPLQGVLFEDLQNMGLTNVHLVEGATPDQDVIITCHGLGGSWQIANHVAEILPYHIISFNFPNHGSEVYVSDPNDMCFGSLKELEPLIEIMHTCVVKGSIRKLHLYGFSMGGGALVNTLAVLKKGRYKGMPKTERRAILRAIQAGTVILDCPMKSIEEIIDYRGPIRSLVELNKQFEQNNLVPINSLASLKRLRLYVLLHFTKPDIIVANRDDELYAEKLTKINKRGKTICIQSNRGIHFPCLPPVQEGYQQLLKERLKRDCPDDELEFELESETESSTVDADQL